MRLGVIVSVVLGFLAASDGFLVAPGSGVPGGIISGLWWILKVALSVALIKKGKEKKELYEYPSPYYHDPPEPTYDPPAQGYHKRSTQETWGEEVVELEKLLVSAASRLDTDGCVLKLLCHLNNKQAHARSLEENVLLQLFSSYPETPSSYHATFGNTAADVSKTQEQVAAAATSCDEVFPSCTLGQEELSSLLQHTWPCPTVTP